VVALQLARNGITSSRLSLYVGAKAGGASYDLFPALTQEAWEHLRRGKVRSVSFRVANPSTLRAADATATSVRAGFQRFKDALGTTNIDVTLSNSRGDTDIEKSRVMRLFSWLQREREENGGGVSRLSASVIDEGENAAAKLNLTEAQMGATERLELLADDPEHSYRERARFARRVLSNHSKAIESQND
jgi:hypothetical protein